MIVVVMGVSGSGKSTVGALLAARLGVEFLDADEFHPQENVAKMAAGVPLTDEDRRPWLARLNAELRKRGSAVLACSALKDSYRRILAEGVACRFAHLCGPIELIRARMQSRSHRYMPASLLESQFAALEPPADAIVVDIAEPPERCAERIRAALGGMKRVAVFGNAGGGKSTLARELAAITGLPLAVVDELQYRVGGVKVPHEEYLRAHAALLANDEWIIDGFGGITLLWERLDAADTLIHVDLPLAVHAFWVTKRLIKGLFVAPQGWPEGSPVIGSSIASYRVLWPCHARLTPRYRAYVSDAAQRKRVFHLRSRQDMRSFLESMRNEHAR